jgi:hypothetical protein
MEARFAEVSQCQQDSNRKELSTPKAFGAREHRDENSWCFFFVIFAFFVVNSVLVAACHPAFLAACGPAALCGLIPAWT